MSTSVAKSGAKPKPSRNTRYRRGANIEYRAKAALQSQGYLVIRAAGSHGPADLVAMRPAFDSWKRQTGPEVLLVQCKRSKNRLTPGEKSELAWIADRLGCSAVLVASRLEAIKATGGRRLVLDWFEVRSDGTMAVMHGEG